MKRIKIDNKQYRITIFIFSLFILCSSIAAQNSDKKITIQNKNISLKDAFSQIEKQTGYSIAYEQSTLDLKKRISLSFKDMDIDKALKQTLKGTNHDYQIKGYHIIVSPLKEKEKPQEKKPLTQTIKGVVIDESSEQPIAFANVSIVNGNNLGAITDSLGYFIIRNVPIGRYDIQTTFMGYEPRIIGEVVVTSAKEVYLKISLKENALLLEEVVVRPNIDKSSTVNKMVLTGGRMLTVEEASRFAGGFDDPARLVSSFAGVSGGINSNALVIRGNSPQFTQWRMEDVEIPNPTHYADMTGLGGGLLTGLSSNVLGNSDFYNGAFPSEYTNALGGVFDMSMRNGNTDKYEHAFQVGVWGLDLASEGPISKKHNSSYLFNYRYSFSGISDAVSGTDEGLDYQDLAFKLNFPTKRAGTFTLWGLGLLDKVLQKEEEDSTKWEYTSDKQRSNNKFTKGMFGLGHKIYINDNTYLKSSLATTYSKVHGIIDQVDKDFNYHRMADVRHSHTDIILSSYLNKKFRGNHTNRTGFTLTRLSYNLDFNTSDKPGLCEPMRQIAKGDGSDHALSVFTNSVFRISPNWEASIGLTGQVFTLNNNWTLEPRASIKWQLPKQQSLAFAYGLNSTRERLDYYYVKTPETGDELVNKKLDFSKAHHFSLSYSKKLSDQLFLKIEPYYQYLYDVPVEAGTSFSILNYNAYGLDKRLVNKGKGRNYGVDITLERYLKDGWYGLFTGSLFKSEYLGGDKVWRNTRMDQRFILNALAGKEWTFGKNRHKTFSANIRLTYQGGYRYTPIDYDESEHNQGVEQIDAQAYSLRLPNSFTSDLTLRYRINKKKIAHEFSFMILNATGFRQTGYVYNLETNSVEKKRSAPIVPSISWKIYF
ncbi:TonB-dependent receptor [Dysgonomonas sp. 520]|uniref:TonB-dependent receptor n=1 Tax=Dysgonomonas sp. 520 TaxID=2302931 RepID=UPI0013D12115|nr:TonB-dependent receptor [Dysgonomonas sp. 520]NDW08441.1 prevent-host-death protein [Dysgonomonas sp. 520]